jgi:hypothetical protein
MPFDSSKDEETETSGGVEEKKGLMQKNLESKISRVQLPICFQSV